MAAPNRPPPRTVEVVRKVKVTPNMLRVTLGGAGLAGFPASSEGGYIKLRLHPDGPDGALVVRTYTIRHQREHELDIDFVLHADTMGSHGPATEWALHSSPGDFIEIGGPGPAKHLPPDFDFYLVAGDMTALPAISVNLEKMPAHATGYAVIEVRSIADRQELACPDGVDVDWIVNPNPGLASDGLVRALQIADPGNERCYAWAAAEFNSMRALREYLRIERGFGANRLYLSSYWKHGIAEDEHKRVKREDAMSATLLD